MTILPGAISGAVRRAVFDERGQVVFASDALDVNALASLQGAAAGDQGCSLAELPAGSVFVERIAPAQRLVIFGAGEDARPLARFAAEIGWSVIVADSRVQHARPERFPTAQRVAVCTAAAQLPVTSTDAVVLMTHSYEQDRRLLAELLPLAPRYLGLLGARHRSSLLLQEAAELAGVPLAFAVERTHAPIGLELGGDGPDAVALAIVAEVQHALFADAAAVHARRMTPEDVERQLAAGPKMPVRRDACALDAEFNLLLEGSSAQPQEAA